MTSAATRDVTALVARVLRNARLVGVTPGSEEVRVLSATAHETASVVELVVSFADHTPHTYTIDVRRDS